MKHPEFQGVKMGDLKDKTIIKYTRAHKKFLRETGIDSIRNAEDMDYIVQDYVMSTHLED